MAHNAHLKILYCWLTMIMNLQNYSSLHEHKILWFDTIETCYEENFCLPNNFDVIIDTAKKTGTRLFFKDFEGKNPTSVGTRFYDNLTEDYVPTYEKMYEYFKKHKTLDETLESEIEGIEKRSVHQLLTPENIAKIKEAIIERNASPEEKERKKNLMALNNLSELTNTLQALQSALS